MNYKYSKIMLWVFLLYERKLTDLFIVHYSTAHFRLFSLKASSEREMET
jgi:hypothetical protein